MIHFQLPKNTPILYQYIDCIHDDNNIINHPIISTSLSYYLNDIKKRIDSRESEWDITKRYTNPCEYIHSIVPNKKKSVAKKKPLSRSYFKMIELLYFFKIVNNDYIENQESINSFHLAEGPGGFIEALLHVRNNQKDNYIGMSILDDDIDPNIPGWKKSKCFLDNNSNVKLDHGADGTGDILKLDNFEYCKNKYGNKMDIITGDGGFDFSVDFNNQEYNIGQLLFGQIAYAIVMQKKNGTFILKIFDCFMQHTLDLLSILSSFYDKVYITKPQTSRYGNSEKYLVCKFFNGTNCEVVYPYLYNAFEKMLNNDKLLIRFLKNPINLLFSTKIEEYNAIFGQNQIENIHYTLSLIDSDKKDEKINVLIKNNVKKSTDWCIKYGVLYNSINISTNFVNDEHH